MYATPDTCTSFERLIAKQYKEPTNNFYYNSDISDTPETTLVGVEALAHTTDELQTRIDEAVTELNSILSDFQYTSSLAIRQRIANVVTTLVLGEDN